MKPVRTLVVAVVAVLAAVIAAAPARACIPTAFGAERVGGGPVAPGDPVSFVFSARGERDSAYEVSAGGRSVASGTGRPNTENAGSFTMPDLGRGGEDGDDQPPHG
jgi:hypothetical protein